mgnify:CR=1 FL=1
MGKKVLVVDDERLIVKGIKFSLVQDDMEVDCAYDGEEALEMAKKTEYDMVLLDVMLPDEDGLSLVKRLRSDKETVMIPVLMVTAKTTELDKVKGLDLGADDYMTKPFLSQELVLRVSAILKRTYAYQKKEQEEKKTISLGKRTVVFSEGIVLSEGQEIPLTAKELLLLEKLCENRGKIVTFDALCQAAWEDSYYGYENTLMVHIRHLREKIEEDPSHPVYLLTARGLGYRLAR